GELAEELSMLEGPAKPHCGKGLGLKPGHVGLAEPDAPLLSLNKSCYGIDEGGFSGAIWANYAVNIPRLDRNGNIGDGCDDAKAYRQALGFKKRHGRAPYRPHAETAEPATAPKDRQGREGKTEASPAGSSHMQARYTLWSHAGIREGR